MAHSPHLQSKEAPPERKHFRNPVIPVEKRYLREEEAGVFLKDEPVSLSGELDIPAICTFVATGMFLGQDTYFRDLKVPEPGMDYTMDPSGRVVAIDERFRWRSEPRVEVASFGERLDVFEALLDAETAAAGRPVVALSGGLDSRTLAAALSSQHARVASYSYAFEGGIDEQAYGRRIGYICGFDHRELRIPRGYLWGCLDKLAMANACYSEFTHPRQMAAIDSIGEFGDTLYLGHWGDVLFDGFGLTEESSLEEIARFTFDRFVKRDGLELAGEIWSAYFPGEPFERRLKERFRSNLEAIGIAEPNARVRAFKSMHWAPRWTSVNLSIFESVGTLVVPYYSEAMCRFVCATPEPFLRKRMLQIEYIKRKSPELARVPWQSSAPFDLYDHGKFFKWQGLPVRARGRLERDWRSATRGRRVKYNWEGQFLGVENEARLKVRLLETPALFDVVDSRIVRRVLADFSRDPHAHWHAVSMLLTLALFSSHRHRWTP